MGANLPNTDPYWMNRRQELEAFTFYRRKEVGDLPAYFHTNSMAEIHWIPLIKLLSKYIASTESKNACDIENEFLSNPQLLRRAVLSNLHIATSYFDARTKNYYNTVCKSLFQVDDYFFRYEFAKGRGQIHSHGILFSKEHAKKVEDALDHSNESLTNEDRAKRLQQWLQTDSENSDTVFSPGFVSLHPAGGKLEQNDEKKTWIPNKEGWPLPEGTQKPPDFNPLQQKITQCKTQEEIDDLTTHIVNKVGIHQCNGYCLRKKKVDSKTRYCRSHFGKEDPITKKTTGKDLHPFDPWIVGTTHPRYEGARDHPRLIMFVKDHLSTWMANCDTQVLIDRDLLNLQNTSSTMRAKELFQLKI